MMLFRKKAFRIRIPDNVNPGEEFEVFAGGRIVRVLCPKSAHSGQSLSITVPVDDDSTAQNILEDSPNVRRIDDPNPSSPAADVVTIPLNGQQLPTEPTRTSSGPVQLNASMPTDENTELFEVNVPPGVQPGQPFALLAGGQRVLVTCPPNALPGDRLRFKLPLVIKATNEAAKIKLKYDKDGWTRTVRITDLKFQWVRMDDKVRCWIVYQMSLLCSFLVLT